MPDLKGTKTEKNLWEAFAGESMARNKYSYWSSAAKKEGYEQIAAIFMETADNEKEHAKLWFKALNGIGDTMTNLLAAAAGEHEEWTSMYKRMSEEAAAEGFTELSKRFALVAEIESNHEKRYRALAANLEKCQVFAKEKATVWKCRNCGHKYTGAKAPEICPACAHPKAYFEIDSENY